MKGSWRAVEAWYYEKPNEAIGEGAASIAVETQRLTGSWTEAEVQFHVAGSESLKKAKESLLMKM